MHTHGIVRAIAKPLWCHLRDYCRSPAYRALHRFARQLRRHGGGRIVSFAGRPIRIADGPSFLSAWDEIFVNRCYDIGDCGHVPRLVDAGANIGLAALYWKLRYGQFDYLGFEADPAIAAICRENLAAWGVGGELHTAAVMARAGTVVFHPDGADGGRVVEAAAGPGDRSVSAERLGPALGGRVDLLKLDIEGAEAEVLRDVAEQLGGVRNIFVELHSRPGIAQSYAEVLGLLQRAGFRCHVQVGFASEQPLAGAAVSPGGYDGLLNVFGVRER